MKKATIMFFFTFVFISTLWASNIRYDDGESHLLDHQLYHDDRIMLDSVTYNNPGTELHIVNGGLTAWVVGYERSNLVMDGGTVSESIGLYHYATATISSGTIGGNLQGNSNTNVNMTGGNIQDRLNALNNANITLSGGSVGLEIQSFNSATISLVGSNFQVTAGDNTYDLSYGDKLSDFGILETAYSGDRRYVGTISGTLQDGSFLTVPFKVWNMDDYAGTADIYIIPEPTTLSLLALGAILTGRRRRV